LIDGFSSTANTFIASTPAMPQTANIRGSLSTADEYSESGERRWKVTEIKTGKAQLIYRDESVLHGLDDLLPHEHEKSEKSANCRRICMMRGLNNMMGAALWSAVTSPAKAGQRCCRRFKFNPLPKMAAR
jgi:hypothetical protein